MKANDIVILKTLLLSTEQAIEDVQLRSTPAATITNALIIWTNDIFNSHVLSILI